MKIAKFKNQLIIASILLICLLVIIFWQFTGFNKENIVDQNNKSDDTEETVFPLPRFSDYYTNLGDDLIKSIAINYNSNPEIDEYYKLRIENTIIPDTNFAYSYRIFTVGCGTECHHIVVIDSSNGNIYFPNIVSRVGMDFDSYSKLLIVNPPKDIYETYGNDTKIWEGDLKTYFYVWENNNFKLIKTAKINYKMN